MAQSQSHQTEEEKPGHVEPQGWCQTEQRIKSQTDSPDYDQDNQGRQTAEERTIDITKV